MSVGGLAWEIGARLAAPLLRLLLLWRARRGKEIAARLEERRGGGAARPQGPLFWLHAASVGEMLSVLPVLEAMAARRPALHILLTTGTVTSARLLASRLPPALHGRLTHRFVPLDVPGWVGRFLDGWRPDAGAFVESELWPNLLAATDRRGLPLALVNARMSARSAARWRGAPGLLAQTMAPFRLVLARSEEDAARLAGLVGRRVESWGDLKWAAPPLPADPAVLAALKARIGDRPVFLVAQSHPGEEELALAAHRALLADFPRLLTILVPRHPERGPAILEAAAGLSAARRGAGEQPEAGTGIYVADTLGELGLFYRLATAALVGKSIVGRGGQNPLEPARLGCPILFGPHMANFAEPVARLLEAGGALRLPNPAALAPMLRDVLSNPDRARAMALAAAAVADRHAGLPDRVAEALLGLLPPEVPVGLPAAGRDTNEA